jgi:hypothetical protein
MVEAAGVEQPYGIENRQLADSQVSSKLTETGR